MSSSRAAQALARELGMPIGLYGDYAVGAHPSGSETWVDQSRLSAGRRNRRAARSAGALKGQGWGMPPPDPVVMESRATRRASCVLIRDNMRCYGALRLDHVMSLFRLWWVPAGRSPPTGRLRALSAAPAAHARSRSRARAAPVWWSARISASCRTRCAGQCREFGLYHYKVLLFEKEAGRFRRPEEFVRRALATVTTHDMPTLRSFWEGRDIDLRRDLTAVSDRPRSRMRSGRGATVTGGAARRARGAKGLRRPRPASPTEPFTPELAHAMHLYLARSRAASRSVQIEDLLGMVDPVNVPGTYREYPNWQRKLTADIEGDRRARPTSMRCLQT